jgi:hypothetical protein
LRYASSLSSLTNQFVDDIVCRELLGPAFGVHPTDSSRLPHIPMILRMHATLYPVSPSLHLAICALLRLVVCRKGDYILEQGHANVGDDVE